jgi:hypothetical protein
MDDPFGRTNSMATALPAKVILPWSVIGRSTVPFKMSFLEGM